MRYLSYLAGFALTLTLNTAIHAQDRAVDPFDVVSAEITSAERSNPTIRFHKANGGDRKVSVYKSTDGVKIESMGSEKNPDWMRVNLGQARTETAQAHRKRLEATFTKAYGTPASVRGDTTSWDVPAISGHPRHAKMTAVMLYVDDSGDQMLKLDRRKGGIGTPAASRRAQKAPAAVKSTPQTVSRQTQIQPIWDGQPD